MEAGEVKHEFAKQAGGAVAGLLKALDAQLETSLHAYIRENTPPAAEAAKMASDAAAQLEKAGHEPLAVVQQGYLVLKALAEVPQPPPPPPPPAAVVLAAAAARGN